MFTFLVTNSHQKPEREGQVRPLVELTPAQAQLAWQYAVEQAGGRGVTARLVKRVGTPSGLAGICYPIVFQCVQNVSVCIGVG